MNFHIEEIKIKKKDYFLLLKEKKRKKIFFIIHKVKPNYILKKYLIILYLKEMKSYLI